MLTTRASRLIRIRNRDDNTAWSQFDSIYRPMLTRFAIARGMSPADAEEIAQQCMVTIHQHIQSFEYDPKKGRFKAWLRTMVSNRVKNHRRDRREQSADTAAFRRDQEREPEPDEVFEQMWLEEHLRHCLTELRQEVGEVTFGAFHAYAIQERPAKEVCQEFALNDNQLYKLKWKLTQLRADKMKALVEGAE